jgi:hypothetical protein
MNCEGTSGAMRTATAAATVVLLAITHVHLKINSRSPHEGNHPDRLGPTK